MATIPGTIPEAPFGISGRTLEGFIIQDDDVNDEPIVDTLIDQVGQTVDQTHIDGHETLSVSMIGAGTPPKAGDVFDYDSKKWWVRSARRVGNYQSRVKYSVNAERWTHFPQTTNP